LALLLAAPSTAANAALPLEYDCDAAAGSFSELKPVSATGYPVAVRGAVAFVKARMDKDWLPGASASLTSKSGEMVMFRVAAAERDKGPLRLQLLTKVKGKVSEQEVGTAKLDEVVRFAIRPAPNAFTVTIGDRSFRVETETANDWSTQVTCTTGEFVYTDLQFGD
jgi:hypothetical protein